MKETVAPTCDVRIYLGSKYGYGEQTFSIYELQTAIGQIQKTHAHACPVRITPTTFQMQDYVESGWEIAVGNYPLYKTECAQVAAFARELAHQLAHEFRQHRVTVVYPYNTITYDYERTEMATSKTDLTGEKDYTPTPNH